MIRIFGIIWLSVWATAVCCANEPAMEPIQQSLRDGTRSVWFEPEAVQVKPIELNPQVKDTLHRHSRWVPKAKSAQTNSTSTSSSSSSNSPSVPSGTGSIFGWVMLITLGVIAAGLLIFVFLKIGDAVTVDLSSSKSSELSEDLAQQTAMRIKELPSELRRENMDLKAEAMRLMNTGDLDEAIKCLFGYQLLLLDRHGFLRLSRGKTNNRYVNEVRSKSKDATSLLRSTVDAFEASYFGKHSPSSLLFQRLWESNQVLESIASAQDGAS